MVQLNFNFSSNFFFIVSDKTVGHLPDAEAQTGQEETPFDNLEKFLQSVDLYLDWSSANKMT